MPSTFSPSRTKKTAKNLRKSAREIADSKLVQDVKLRLARTALWVGKLIATYQRMKEYRPVPREEEEASKLLQLEE